MIKIQDYVEERSKHLTNEEIANSLGLTPGMVSKYRHHEHIPPLYLAVKVYQISAGVVVLFPYAEEALLEQIAKEKTTTEPLFKI